jgi:hypothetical protein
MSDECEDRNHEGRLRALEAWRRTVMGTRPTPEPEPDLVEVWMARCREVGATEAELAALKAEHGADPEVLVGYLEERAEQDDLRARARRGGLDLDREDRV